MEADAAAAPAQSAADGNARPRAPPARNSLAYRANLLVAIPDTPFASQPNRRKSAESTSGPFKSPARLRREPRRRFKLKQRERRQQPVPSAGASSVFSRLGDWQSNFLKVNVIRSKARLSTILFAENYEVTHGQLCELLKYAVLGKSSVPKPSWCQLFHQNQLNNVVIFVLQGMSQLHFYRFYLEFGFLRKAFRHSGPHIQKLVRMSQTVFLGNLTENSKVSVNLQNDPIIQKRKNCYLVTARKSPVTAAYIILPEYKNEFMRLEPSLVLKANILFLFLLGFPDCENFVPTKCNGSITDSSPLFGLDCEMTLPQLPLVWLSFTHLRSEVGFPCLSSFFSGITKKILNPVATKLKDVQRQLKALLPPDAVLVGHSLDFDLKALKVTYDATHSILFPPQMIHPYVIDTSLLYVREQGRRFKLKFLAKAILGKDIQCPDRLGHDATEDARTTLELARYFLKYGPKKIAELNLEALASHQELQTAVQEPRNTTEVVQQLNTSVLECLDSMGQKLLFLTRETDASELSSSRNCQTIKCLSNKEVLEQARMEIPLFPFSIIQFSFETFSPSLTEEMNKRMRIKWTEMSTVYAGPFSKNCNLRALKRLFKSFGPVQSMTLVLETHQPHLCIQYEVLEAAQLAIESLDGILVDGICIKVQRPVTELTLDCNTLVNELEQDSENRGTIYLSGVSEAFKEQLLQQSNVFFGLEAVILPKDLKSGKQKKYSFLKFKTFGSAHRALNILKGKDWKLKGRHALTPRHLHTWLRGLPPESRRPLGLRVIPPPSEQQALQTLKVDHPKIAAWRWGRKIGNLYYSLCPGTLCLILLPGTKSTHGSHSGLGLMGIKDEEESTTLNMCS
ncbi:hypothetical protein HPG69_005097 [Diceros bicornis minor]|uniref:RRM domain-containing protein n=1 Tax=Diceros bicornis minor TaxID=77932 RepID=A0A7J7EEY1_DICBM|nr:hypothetical protein HPG69_005097 [Diceros bicornis minor]